ncbi:sulfatase [Thermoproteota archaeon]
MKRLIVIIVIGVAVLSLILIVQRNKAEQPNVIIILIDALRRDHLGVYGYYRNTTPNIDRFSQEAIVFQDAISQCPGTSPSVASLFTSLYSSFHGCISYSDKGEEVKADFLNLKLETLAEMFKEKGYRTGAFVANHWICRRLQFDQGFDVFDPIDEVFKPLAFKLSEKAFQWINKDKAKPFFAYLHYMDVHGPYQPPPPYDSFFKSERVRQMSKKESDSLGYLSAGRERDKNDLNYYIDRYDGEIRYTDYHIGRFLEKLREHNLLENTIIVITADHGEAFFDHGFCDHGHTVYCEEINVPLIIKFPKSIKFPDVKDSRVALIDVAATIMRILNYCTSYNVEGLDLIDITNKEVLDSRSIYSQELSTVYPPKIALIKGGYKAVYFVEEQKVTELYNLIEDKLERKNIISGNRDMAKEFEGEIKYWLNIKSQKRIRYGLEEATVIIEDKERKDQLRSLGYIQ